MSIFIRQLEDADSQALLVLRQSAYKRRYGSAVDESYLSWGPADRSNLVLGFFFKTRLIASYRLDTIEADNAAKIELQSHSLNLTYEFPLGIGCRAVTDAEFLGMGTNTYLRATALRAALNRGIRWVWGTSLYDQRWIKYLKRHGYEVFEHNLEWHGFLKPHGRKIVYRIDANAHHEMLENTIRDRRPSQVFSDSPIVNSVFVSSTTPARQKGGT